MTFLRVMGACFLIAGVAFFVMLPVVRIMGGAWIGVGILLIAIGQKAAANAAHRQRLLETGKPGHATILGVTDTGITVNNSPRVRIRARLEAEGQAPVEVTKAMLVSRVAIPSAGEVYEVRFDPKDPNDFAFAVGAARAHGPSPTNATAQVGDTISQLERLTALRDQGALTPAEFEAQKRKLLGEG